MHIFFLISMPFSRFFLIYASMQFCHITAKLAEAENFIGAAQCQNNPPPGVTKFCANLKQKMQILSVLITHANTVLIAQSVNR